MTFRRLVHGCRFERVVRCGRVGRGDGVAPGADASIGRDGVASVSTAVEVEERDGFAGDRGGEMEVPALMPWLTV